MTDLLPTLAGLGALIVLSGLGAAAAWRSVGPERAALDAATPARFAALAYLGLYIAGAVLILASGEASVAGPLLAAGALASFGFGAIVAGRILGPTPRMPPPQAAGFSVVGIGALAAVGTLAIGYLVLENGLPLIASNPQASRTGFAGIVFDLFRWFVPPAALVAFALAIARGRMRERWLAIGGVAAVAGLEVLLASRALPFELGIEALLIAWWAGYRPAPRLWLALGAIGLTVFVGVQLVRVGPEGSFRGVADAAGFAVRRTLDRVVLIHPRTLEVVATSIPEEEPFFAGSTYVRRLAVVLGGRDRPSLGYWIYERLFPGQPGGFAAPGVAGEAWANGGPILVVVLMTALGGVAVWFGQFAARLPGGPVDRALAALLVMATARTYATSLNGFLLTVAVTFGWWYVASGRFGRGLRRLVDRT